MNSVGLYLKFPQEFINFLKSVSYAKNTTMTNVIIEAVVNYYGGKLNGSSSSSNPRKSNNC
jgi:hypothetical protein